MEKSLKSGTWASFILHLSCGLVANLAAPGMQHKRYYAFVVSPYETQLLYDNSTTIHERNLQFLMTEIFKTINNENPPFIKEIFVREDSVYNSRCMFRLVPRVLTTKTGLETISFRGSQIWNSSPKNLKELNSVATFKRAIKGWNGENCNCRICSVK